MNFDQLNQEKKISLAKASELSGIDIDLLLVEALGCGSSEIFIANGYYRYLTSLDEEEIKSEIEVDRFDSCYFKMPGYILNVILNSNHHTYSSSYFEVYDDEPYSRVYNRFEEGYEGLEPYFEISCFDIYMTIGEINNFCKRLRTSPKDEGRAVKHSPISPKKENNLLKAIGALLITSESFTEFKRSDGSFNENGMVEWIQTQLPLKGYHLDGIKERSLRDVFKQALVAIENNRE